MKWITVSKKSPCPICKKPDWCGVSEDGTKAICMRASNSTPTKNGGFLWVWENGRWDEPQKRPLGAFLPPRGHNLPPPPLKPPRIAPKWGHRRLSAKEVREFILGDMVIRPDWAFGVADICGDDSDIECGTACALGMYESKTKQHCVGIPMRDAMGQPVGIRFRHTLTKKKSSLFGGSDGLFYSQLILKRKVKTLYIVEGATDAIALASLGFDVVGRSSCATGTELIRDLLRRIKPTELVYVSDNDHAKEIAGRLREAGREGAIKLAKDIGMSYKLISPISAKDIREYILNQRKKGFTSDQISSLILTMVKDAKTHFPDKKVDHPRA